MNHIDVIEELRPEIPVGQGTLKDVSNVPLTPAEEAVLEQIARAIVRSECRTS